MTSTIRPGRIPRVSDLLLGAFPQGIDMQVFHYTLHAYLHTVSASCVKVTYGSCILSVTRDIRCKVYFTSDMRCNNLHAPYI
jgi:hypothetical protein